MMNSVPSYARGLNILLVHHDRVALTYLELLLEQYSFKVTAVDVASKAASIIRNQQGHFKLVMAKFNMPDMDSLSFLNLLLQTDIPIIFISSGRYDDITQKALVEGCYFLEEPIRSQDLKYVWQHVYHRRFEPKEIQNANCEDKAKSWDRNFKVLGANEKKRACDETEGIQKGKSLKLSSSQSVKTRQLSNNNGSAAKRIRRNIWTPDLHRKFTEAMSALGEKNIRPKLLLEKLNEPHLKLRQVASHLQYYRSQLQRVQKVCKSDSPSPSKSSNLRRRTKFPKSFQSQSNQGNLASAGSSSGLKGLTAPTASQNKNQNQNQFLVNVAASQGDDYFLQRPETLDNATFQHEPLMGLPNGGNQNLDAIIENPVPAFSTNQNQSLLQPQETYDSASFPQEHSTGLVCYGTQNLEAVEENYVPAGSTNRNQSRFQLQETLGSTAFSYELPTGLPNYGSQNLLTVVQNCVPAGSVHQNQYLLQSQGDATPPYELPTEWAHYGSQKVDTIGGNLSHAASVDRNQPFLQLQEQQSNATFSNGLLMGFANYGNEDLYAVVQNHMPARSVHQNQSLLQPTGNATFSYNHPTILADYGSQNLDVVVGNSHPAASMDQNQSLIHQQNTKGNGTFRYDLPTGLANYGSQNLHAAVQNHVPVGSMHQHQFILQLQETPSYATFPYELQTGAVNFGSQNLDAVVEHSMPASSLDHTQSHRY